MDRMKIKTKLPPNATSADKDNRQFGILWEPDWIDIHNDDQLYARVLKNGRAVIVVGDGGSQGNPKALSPADFERRWQGD